VRRRRSPGVPDPARSRRNHADPRATGLI
jgi:hypothetical protein